MEGRVHLGFTGYTSISRMQIYTDDYFSVFNMMVPTLKFVDSGILSQIVHGPRSAWITFIHAERYCIITFVHAYMYTCAYVVEDLQHLTMTSYLIWPPVHPSNVSCCKLSCKTNIIIHCSTAFARTFHRFAWIRRQRRVPTTSPSGRDDLG